MQKRKDELNKYNYWNSKARIIKKGFYRNKQRYGVVYKNKIIKTSIYKNKLQKIVNKTNKVGYLSDKPKCRWCGKEFEPDSKNQKYCSKICRKYSDLYRRSCNARKYRKAIINGSLVDTRHDKSRFGTGYLGEHRYDDYTHEYKVVSKEKRRLGLD